MQMFWICSGRFLGHPVKPGQKFCCNKIHNTHFQK